MHGLRKGAQLPPLDLANPVHGACDRRGSQCPLDACGKAPADELDTFCPLPQRRARLPGPDWAHVFLSVLPTLPLNTATDEARIAAALRAAGATVMARYGAALRRAAVAEWEVRLRVPDGSGAWRLVVSSPTGAPWL